MEFIGYSLVKIDSKGRVVVPAKFRKQLENNKLILSKIRVVRKPVIAVFPTIECAKDLLNSYYNFSENNYDRNLSLSMSECFIGRGNNININKLLENREEKEMVAVGRRVNFELWYRSDLEDYCESENLQLCL